MSSETYSPAFEHIKILKGLQDRPQQREGIGHIQESIASRHPLFLQSPTGSGKSLMAVSTGLDEAFSYRELHRDHNAPAIIATATNNLANQYHQEVARLSEKMSFRYQRVMGAANYLCVWSSSKWSEEDQKSKPAPGSFFRPGSDNELADLGLGPEYGCPGYPACGGGVGGAGCEPGACEPDCEGCINRAGCGSKTARFRARSVDLVLTNFHMVVWNELFPAARLLPPSSLLVFDEGHLLPSVVSEALGREWGRTTGAKAFKFYPELYEAAVAAFESATDEKRIPWPWGRPQYSLEGAATPSRESVQRLRELLTPDLREAWSQRILKAEEAALTGHEDLDNLPDIETESPAYTLESLNMLVQANNPQSRRLVAWAKREWDFRSMTHVWPEVKKGVREPTIKIRDLKAPAEFFSKISAQQPTVVMSATIGQTLPFQMGASPETPMMVRRLGEVFDWSQVKGRISLLEATKSGSRLALEQRDEQRLDQLSAELHREKGSLVLCNSFADVKAVSAGLRRRGLVVFEQPREGGSLAADEVREQYVRSRRPSVLVGTNSYATGVDLKGDLCTAVAWWTCHKGGSGFFEARMEENYPGYSEDRFRARFAQGIGRLLRTPTDRGKVIIMDQRGWDHVWSTQEMDRHLSKIEWSPLTP